MRLWKKALDGVINCASPPFSYKLGGERPSVILSSEIAREDRDRKRTWQGLGDDNFLPSPSCKFYPVVPF